MIFLLFLIFPDGARVYPAFLRIHISQQMWLVPAPHDFDPLAENDAIMAGPGNASLRNTRLHTDSLAQLQWIVGCGGNVAKKEQVNHVEAAARDGTLQNFLSVPVHGWSVTQVNHLLDMSYVDCRFPVFMSYCQISVF